MVLPPGSPGPLYRENKSWTDDAAAGPAGSAVAVGGREPSIGQHSADSPPLVPEGDTGAPPYSAGLPGAGFASVSNSIERSETRPKAVLVGASPVSLTAPQLTTKGKGRGTRTRFHAVLPPPPRPQQTDAQTDAGVNIAVRWPPKLEVKWGKAICFAFDKELEEANITPTVAWPHCTVFHRDWVNGDLRISLCGDGGNVERIRNEEGPPLSVKEIIGNIEDLKTVMQSQLCLINAQGVRCNLKVYGNGLQSLRITGPFEQKIESVRAQLQIVPHRQLHVAVAAPKSTPTAPMMYAKAAQIFQQKQGQGPADAACPSMRSVAR